MCAQGNPPLTGTGTLSIYIMDENDNPPSLIVNSFEMCQSDKPSWVNVSAVDPDDGPYGGPFWFTLIGDVKNNWRIDPEQGEMCFSNCFILSISLFIPISISQITFKLPSAVQRIQCQLAVCGNFLKVMKRKGQIQIKHISFINSSLSQ